MLLLGLCGPAAVGKDTVADAIGAHWDDGATPIVRYAFARPIKEAASVLFDLPIEAFDDRARKDAPLDNLGGRTPRALLQLIGTDWVRETIDARFWIARFERAYARARDRGAAVMVVTDVRFPNEADAIRALCGTIVRVTRVATPTMSSIERAHPSETHARALIGDAVLHNDASVGVLSDNARALLARLAVETGNVGNVAKRARCA